MIKTVFFLLFFKYISSVRFNIDHKRKICGKKWKINQFKFQRWKIVCEFDFCGKFKNCLLGSVGKKKKEKPIFLKNRDRERKKILYPLVVLYFLFIFKAKNPRLDYIENFNKIESVWKAFFFVLSIYSHHGL